MAWISAAMRGCSAGACFEQERSGGPRSSLLRSLYCRLSSGEQRAG